MGYAPNVVLKIMEKNELCRLAIRNRGGITCWFGRAYARVVEKMKAEHKVFCNDCGIRINKKTTDILGIGLKLKGKEYDGIEYLDGWKCKKCGGN